VGVPIGFRREPVGSSNTEVKWSRVKDTAVLKVLGAEIAAIYLFVATNVGYGEARHAFFELLAG